MEPYTKNASNLVNSDEACKKAYKGKKITKGMRTGNTSKPGTMNYKAKG